jgi:hypothetical protein
MCYSGTLVVKEGKPEYLVFGMDAIGSILAGFWARAAAA